MPDPWGGRPPPEVRDYVSVFRRRWLWILAVTILATGIGVAWSSSHEDVYRASGQLVLQAADVSDAEVLTEARVIESNRVHELALGADPDVGDVNATQDGTTRVITVTSESPVPQRAADTVNAHMQGYVDYQAQAQTDRFVALTGVAQRRLAEVVAAITARTPAEPAPPPPGTTATGDPELDALVNERDALQARLRALETDIGSASIGAQVVSQADPPSTPIRPKPRQDGLIALGAGLVLAIAIAFLIEYLDNTIKTSDDLQSVVGDMPLLGLVPRPCFAGRRPIVLTRPGSSAAEAYRALRTSISSLGLDHGCRIEFTSDTAEEAKTQTVVNLAVSMAQAGTRVILVDCNLRRPQLHEFFYLDNDAGLTSVVFGAPLSSVLRSVRHVENLRVLPAGPCPGNPSEVLASDRCHEILAKLQEDEDAVVLLDAAPLLPVTDAAVLAASATAVVLVTQAEQSTRKQLRQAVRILRQINAPIVGIVLQHAKDATTSAYSRSLWRRRPVALPVRGDDAEVVKETKARVS